MHQSVLATQFFTLPTRARKTAHQETMAALHVDTPLERGQALAIEGDFAGALEALTEATTANEKDAKAWEATAQVLLAASASPARGPGAARPAGAGAAG